jgi:hypothetical protein
VKRSRLAARVALSLVVRLTCYGLMVWLALWGEARPAPGPLPDLVLSWVPYVPWVDRQNYLLWIVAYVPVALWLLATDAERFLRYMYSAGLLAVVRGLCIAATGLGPVQGGDVNAGLSDEARWHAFTRLMTPAFFDRDGGARVYLTKDLFFSGHTATTFLLLLYVWRYPRLRAVMLGAHMLVVASVFLSHLHYTIDVIGAWAITFAVYSARERRAVSVTGA